MEDDAEDGEGLAMSYSLRYLIRQIGQMVELGNNIRKNTGFKLGDFIF